jgi:preprotein translocase subunit SecE
MTNFFTQALQFVKEAVAELKKVSWLSKKEAVASTIVVIIIVILVAVYVGFVDFVLARILGALL